MLFAEYFQQVNHLIELLDYHFAYEMEADAYSWTFGDGGFSNQRFPKHTYANNGNFTVCITAELFNCGSVTHCEVFQNVGVEEKKSYKLNVYPNPTNNNIQIEIENYYGSFQAELYDFTGKLLETTNKTSLSLADCSSGIYLLKVAYGDRIEQLKVIKD